MSVVATGLFVTIHLFGFMTSEKTETPFASMQQCENYLQIQRQKYVKRPGYVVESSQRALKISNADDATIWVYQCKEFE